jgi:hypothetical protein
MITRQLKPTHDLPDDPTTIKIHESGVVIIQQDEDIVVLDSSQMDQLEQLLKDNKDRLVREQMEANIKAYEDG